MNREAKKLLKKNNQREKEILEENDEVYTNMVVYLRVADITEYNQEKVREDLIEMIIDGQNRGDDIQKVMGENYKEICDDIIAEMPKKTGVQKVMDVVGIILNIIWIMGLISIIKAVIYNLTTDNGKWLYEFKLGDLVSWTVIGIVANVIVHVICKTAFDEDKQQTDKKSRIISFVAMWLVCFVVICAMILPMVLLDTVLIEVNMWAAVAVFAAVFVGSRLVSLKY